MKRIFILFSIVLLVSISINIKSHIDDKHDKAYMIHYIYSDTISATRHLKSFINEYNDNDIERAEIQLNYAAIYLMNLDNLIKYGTIIIDPKIYHPGIFSFGYIGEGLMFGGNVNDKRFEGIVEDGLVTTNEMEYVKLLISDLETITTELTLKEPFVPNENLSIKELNIIMGKFYEVWRNVYDDTSPYILRYSD